METLQFKCVTLFTENVTSFSHFISDGYSKKEIASKALISRNISSNV